MEMKWAACHQCLPLFLPDPFVRGQEDNERPEGLPPAAFRWTLGWKDDLPQKSHQLVLNQPRPPTTSVQAKGERVPQTQGPSQSACSYPAPEAWEANSRRTCCLSWWYMNGIWMGLRGRKMLLCNRKSGWTLMKQCNSLIRTLVSCCHSRTMEFCKFLRRKVLNLLFAGNQSWPLNLYYYSCSEGVFLIQHCRKRLVLH